MNLWTRAITLVALCLLHASRTEGDDNEYRKWYQMQTATDKGKNLTTVQSYYFYTDAQDLTSPAAETTENENESITGTLEFSTVDGSSLNTIDMEEVDKKYEELGFNISNLCSFEGNNTSICKVDCQNGSPYLECFNGGICVFDNHLFPVCSCPRTDTVVYTGPHCEYRVTLQSRASCGCGCDLRLFFILMAIACSIVVMLVMLNVFTVMRYKRSKNVTKVQQRIKGPSVRMTDSQVDSVVINTGFEHPDEDKTPTFSSVRTGTNRLYFDTPSNAYLDDGPESQLPFSNPGLSNVYDSITDPIKYGPHSNPED